MKTPVRTCIRIADLAATVLWAVRPASAESPATNAPPPMAEETGRNKWSFSASATTYFVPDDENYVQPTVTADHDWLHLEARYNYEALDTGSAWEFTPMVGGVFGHTSGIAPGYEGSLSWWILELYSEGEYLLNSAGSHDSFFYNWSELSLAPVDWFRFGFVTERTRAYKSDVDIQRGFLVGFSYMKVDLTTYVFNPDESKPTVVAAVNLHF